MGLVGKLSPRVILFDYGHTLIDLLPWPQYLAALRTELEPLVGRWLAAAPQGEDGLLPHILTAVVEAYEGSYRRGEVVELDLADLYRQAFRRHQVELPEPVVRRVVATDLELFARTSHAPETTVETLFQLRQRGYRLGVVSNNVFRRRQMLRCPLLSGRERLFATVVLSAEVGLRKPHPKIYRVAFQKLRVAPQEVLFVGDRLREDIRGPKALGVPHTLLSHEFRQEPDELKEADGILTRFAELLDHL